MEARLSKDSIGLGLPIAHRWHRIIARDLDTVLIKAAMVDSAQQSAQFENPLEPNANLSRLGQSYCYVIDFTSEI